MTFIALQKLGKLRIFTKIYSHEKYYWESWKFLCFEVMKYSFPNPNFKPYAGFILGHRIFFHKTFDGVGETVQKFIQHVIADLNKERNSYSGYYS